MRGKDANELDGAPSAGHHPPGRPLTFPTQPQLRFARRNTARGINQHVEAK
jgi:hypothetical protein